MKGITDNQMAAFIDGNADAQETKNTMEAVDGGKSFQEALRLSAEIGQSAEAPKVLPMTALAAADTQRNRCAMLCELYILRKHGVERSESEWEKQAVRQGWLKAGGMALFNIGRLLEQECFSISRSYHNNIENVSEALSQNKDVIVVVDKNELTTNTIKLDNEYIHDFEHGATPNHAIVVTSVEENRVKYYDPAQKKDSSLPLSIFEEAWGDSDCYLVTVSERNFAVYRPHPIDLSDIELPEDVEYLREAIAENAHEVWAETRQSEGWTYGPERNDQLKQTPDMIPYSDLTDSEREYDRLMAMNTIKLLRKLGYEIVKRTLLFFFIMLTSLSNAQNINDAVDLGLSVNWATHNVGAKSQFDVGYYFAWGENKEKNVYNFENYLYMEDADSQWPAYIGDDIRSTQYDAAKILLGGNWRMPTYNEFVELYKHCSWVWTEISGISGYEITGSNGNKIFLPVTGQKNGTKLNRNTEGFYWSSTLAQGLGRSAVSLIFDEDNVRNYGEYRIYGQPIRPVVKNISYKPVQNYYQKFWHQDKYIEAITSIENEDYTNAISCLLPLTTSGDAPSQCVLAALYLYGADGNQDYTSALELLVASAKQGFERAEYMLGCFGSLAKSREFAIKILGADESSIDDSAFWKQMFLNGYVSSIQSFKDAFNWFYMLDGTWGYRDIMYFSAISFLNGQYGIKDEGIGMKWLKKSADLDYEDAKQLLEELNEK